MKEAKGKITTKKSGNGGYISAWIYIPSKVYKDKLFPFQDDEEIIIEFWKDKEELLVKIFDFAENVDIDTIKSRDLEDIRPGGLGVHIIHQVMDSVEYKNNTDGKGNVLEMRKQLNNPVVCCIDEQYKK